MLYIILERLHSRKCGEGNLLQFQYHRERRTWTKSRCACVMAGLMVSPKIPILRRGTHEKEPSKGWLVFWRNEDTRVRLDFPHSVRILNVHLMPINVAAVGCSTTNPILSTSNKFCKSIVNTEDSWSKYSSNITVSSIHSKSWFGEGQNFIIGLIHPQIRNPISIKILSKHLRQWPSLRCDFN